MMTVIHTGLFCAVYIVNAVCHKCSMVIKFCTMPDSTAQLHLAFLRDSFTDFSIDFSWEEFTIIAT